MLDPDFLQKVLSKVLHLQLGSLTQVFFKKSNFQKRLNQQMWTPNENNLI
jgi:hypothetical protein